MKKIVIMSMALFVLVLSGCKDNDDDKKKECEEKGASWVWDVTKKECVAKATTKEECDKKGTGWLWDETNKVCNQSTVELIYKETCEAKGADWLWNEGAKKCITPYVTIINSTNRFIAFGPYSTERKVLFSLLKGECASIDDQEFKDYSSSLRIITLAYEDSTESIEEGYYKDIICRTEEDNKFNLPCPSDKGVYEVSSGRTGFVVTKIDDKKTIEELKKMGCLNRYSHTTK